MQNERIVFKRYLIIPILSTHLAAFHLTFIFMFLKFYIGYLEPETFCIERVMTKDIIEWQY